MKYQHIIIIDLPRNEVVEKFNSVDNLRHWQKGFISFEHLEGTPRKMNAKSYIKYQLGNRKIDMTETVLKNDLPDAFHVTYETEGVFNRQENYFEIIDDYHTKWIAISEFKFTNLIMKIIGTLMPNVFKKQSYAYMVDFKNFAENDISVANEKN
ncbi:SRPBCC family protein [Zhouia amylolytica]|uniref:SRPBCC family protein n=1 Tax=Zhouia amylolytica AD3 TaxID=1286632 RepID=W2UME9_9FLAO|nr:SRPBCC family protein [Zhouia amylolytica]ETN95183.1 hypothetical protein P278_19380 [Zhouia amylolytica AD3]